MLKLPVITTILVVFGFGLADNSITGECSRFQYDLALVKKITEIEHDHEVMKYLLSRYQQLEDTNLGTATILESQVLIQSLQAESKTSFSNIRSMQEVLTSQGNEIQTVTNASSRTITAEVEAIEIMTSVDTATVLHVTQELGGTKTVTRLTFNGVYGSTDSKGPSWAKISGGNPVEFAEMKIRRKS